MIGVNVQAECLKTSQKKGLHLIDIKCMLIYHKLQIQKLNHATTNQQKKT